jgi:hypothetical protein
MQNSVKVMNAFADNKTKDVHGGLVESLTFKIGLIIYNCISNVANDGRLGTGTRIAYYSPSYGMPCLGLGLNGVET